MPYVTINECTNVLYMFGSNNCFNVIKNILEKKFIFLSLEFLTFIGAHKEARKSSHGFCDFSECSGTSLSVTPVQFSSVPSLLLVPIALRS